LKKGQFGVGRPERSGSHPDAGRQDAEPEGDTAGALHTYDRKVFDLSQKLRSGIAANTSNQDRILATGPSH